MRLLLILLLASCATKTAQPPTVITIERPRQDRFFTNRSEQWAKDLVTVSNCVWNLPEFWTDVAKHPGYTHTEDSPLVVAEKLMTTPPHEIVLYTSKNPLTAAISYRSPSKPGVIHLNTRKHPRVIGAMVNTATHEASHHFYGHGDNSPSGKENSVPYAIGTIAQRHSIRCQTTR